MELHLSKDAREGATEFCYLNGIQQFFAMIHSLFNCVDQNLCKLYKAVVPPGQRIAGSSFLMALLNPGGTGPHYDWMDLKEGCCCIVLFGKDWFGGDLAFRDLGFRVSLHPGDVIFFRSAILRHENLPHQGDRRSIVLTTDSNSFTARSALGSQQASGNGGRGSGSHRIDDA